MLHRGSCLTIDGCLWKAVILSWQTAKITYAPLIRIPYFLQTFGMQESDSDHPTGYILSLLLLSNYTHPPIYAIAHNDRKALDAYISIGRFEISCRSPRFLCH